MSEAEDDWFGPEAATFGDRVAGAREAAGMTQAQLAQRLGIGRATLRSWENDLAEPPAETLSTMARVLNVSIMWLLTGEGDGMTAPVDAPAGDGGELKPLVAELRALQSDMRAMAERAGRLETRLRALMEREQA